MTIWIVYINVDKILGLFTKQEYAESVCVGNIGWYWQSRHTVK